MHTYCHPVQDDSVALLLGTNKCREKVADCPTCKEPICAWHAWWRNDKQYHRECLPQTNSFVLKVDRVGGHAQRVEALVNDITICFIRQEDGKPREVVRRRPIGVYDKDAMSISKSLYAALMKQVRAIMATEYKTKGESL